MMYRAYQNERLAISEKLLATARAVAVLADRELQEFDVVLRTLSASQALEEGHLDRFDVIVREALGDDRRWFVLGDPAYRQQINTLAPYGARLPDIPETPALREAMHEGRTYISNLSDDPVAGGPVLYVSRPFPADGELRHTLTLLVRPADLAHNLGLAHYATPEGLVALVDRNNRLLARTRDPENYVGRNIGARMQSLVEQQPEGVHDTVTLDGIPVITAFHRAKNSGWVSVVSAPKSALFASSRKLLWLGLALSALLLATAGFLAAWIMRGLTRGVDSLVAGSEAIMRGDPVAFAASGLSETDFVGSAMTRSAQHLRDTGERLRATLDELRRAEDVLRAQNEDLERRVEERTQRLRETIGELEAFSYSISHDMRAPLRAMHSYAEILQTDHAAGLDPEARRFLERININAARLELLVRDVLAYSRVAKERIETQSVDLDRFVRELVAQTSGVVGARGVVEVPDALPPVRAHQAYLSQIFTNLLGNAFKFVAPGVPPRVEIRGGQSGEFVKITVRDNGIGIDPADFERIFQIFGRVHPTEAYEGTGIGLAIVKKAVQRMGGDFGVESAVGAGSTFWFTLPRA